MMRNSGGHSIPYYEGGLQGLALSRWADNVMLYIDNIPTPMCQMFLNDGNNYAGRFISGNNYVLNTAINGSWCRQSAGIAFGEDAVRTGFIINVGNAPSVFEGVKYSEATALTSFFSRFTTLTNDGAAISKIVVGVVPERSADLSSMLGYIEQHKVMELVPWEQGGQKGMLDLMGTICPITGTSFYQ